MKYWAYVNSEILGPYEKEKLLELPAFSPALLVCPQTPVGEKTEDWKEASSYPEIAALLGGAAPAASGQPAPAPSFEPAPQAAVPAPQPAIETPQLAFKPLKAAQPVEPVPPPAHGDGLGSITISQLSKINASAPQAAAPAANASAGFDPISLSQIVRRTENLSGQEAPKAAKPEGLALEPAGFSRGGGLDAEPELSQQPIPAAAPITLQTEPAPVPAPAPVPSPAPAPAQAAQNFNAQAQAAAATAMDMAALQSLVQRLDALSAAAATRRDIDSAVEPLRQKLDQMGEIITSLKNPQFQREVMDKLTYLENTVGDLKDAFKRQAQAAAPQRAQEAKMERAETVFGVQPASKPAEKSKPEPAKEAAKQEITDQGSKPSRIVPALKKVFKFILTLLLLAAVAVGAVIGLRNFGVFDAFKFLPPGIAEKIPGASAPQPPAQPEGGLPQDGSAPQGEASAGQPEAQPQARPATEPEQQEASAKTPEAEQKKADGVPPEAVPEVIYITRTFKAKAGGNTLENKVYEHATKAGGKANSAAWNVRGTAEQGIFECEASVPAGADRLSYVFKVDRARKTVTPSNEEAKAAFEALVKEKAGKTPRGKKAAAKPAPAAPKPAAKKVAAPEEEYEYVYEEEDGGDEGE